MTELLKAKLQEVSADSNQTPIGDAVPVQFNPTSLKLKLANQTDGGRSRGRQRRQHNGSSSTVLSMELIFDSADEGTDAAPVSVRSKTGIVEKYALPKDDGSETPPRLQFQWDQLIIAGVVESVDINFDHFAANGAPLRAKVSLSIKEQEPKYTFVEGASGPAARDSNNAQEAGNNTNNNTSPGSGTNENNTSSNSDRTEPAMEGETPADFLARQGLDPSAWRGLDVDLSAGLSLQAGVEVGFSAGINASVGVGVSIGVHAEAGVSLEASLGINASAVFSGSASASASLNASASAVSSGSGSSGGSSGGSGSTKKVNGDSAGLALSATGGIQSSLETLMIEEANNVVEHAISAFGQTTSLTMSQNTALALSAESNAGNRHPLQTESQVSMTSVSESLSSAGGQEAAYSLPTADPRSVSFGYGVPLRPLYASALSQTEVHLCSRNDRTPADNGPQFRKQKTTAPWEALPLRDETRNLADQAESKRRQQPCEYLYHPCSCD